MDVNVIIQVIASIFTVIITAILSPLISNYYIKRKFRNMQYLIDSHQILQYLAENFKNKFVEPTIQENLFLVMTGIKTNYNSIGLYIELKNLLGENFNWEIIKNAKPHLKFDNEKKIYVRLRRFQIIFMNFSLISSFILVIMGFLLLMYFSQFEINNFSETLLGYILIFPIFLLAYFLISSVQSIVSANIIKKKIDKLGS